MIGIRPYPDKFSWSGTLDRTVPPLLEKRGWSIYPKPWELNQYQDWMSGAVGMFDKVKSVKNGNVFFFDANSGLAGRYATLHPETNVSMWIHFPMETPRHVQLGKFWCSVSDTVVCASTTAQEEAERLGAEQTIIVPYPIEWKKHITPWEQRDIDFLIVGRDAPIKRLDLARKIARKVGGGKQIAVITGGVPHWKMYEIYQRSKVLISAALIEGFSLAIAEAMYCGCIPVAYPTGIALDWPFGDLIWQNFKQGVKLAEMAQAEGNLTNKLTAEWVWKYTNPESIANAIDKHFCK